MLRLVLQRITSRHNALVARCRSIVRGEDRTTILLEGAHLVDEALAAGIDVERVIVTSGGLKRSRFQLLLDRAESAGIEVTNVSPPVMAALSPVRTPSGIVALARRPSYSGDRLWRVSAPLVLVACGVQDPGNLGAIARVTEAAGAAGIIAAGGGADPFGWKSLRGSMGSTLRLSVLVTARIEDALTEARRHGWRLLAAVPRGGTPLFEATLTGALAVVVGGEGPGLPPEVVDQADLRVSVPMEKPVESLNAAVTAALILYEARRQRGGAKENP
jgi:TrmH family RNA methyltransferase